MKVNNVSLNTQVNMQGSKKFVKGAATAAAALMLTNPIAKQPSNAQEYFPEPIYNVSLPSEWSLSDFERAYALYGDKYDIEIVQDDNIGLYYSYGGKTYSLDGREIKVNSQIIQTPRNSEYKPKFNPQSDYGRLFNIFGNDCDLEVHYDTNIGRYYTYGGIVLDKNGDLITGCFNKDAEDKLTSRWKYSNLTDLMKMFAIYADHYEVEECYDKNIGRYYKYAGRFYTPEGKEIKNFYSFSNNTNSNNNTKPTTKITDIMKMIAIYGDEYQVEEHWDKNYGLYYSYAGHYYKPDGSEIKFKNFVNPIPTPKTTTKPSNNFDLPYQVEYGTDLYYYYMQFRSSYKIKAHWDPQIGTYYQYGPFAFTKEGQFIADTDNLNKFDIDIK